MIILLNIIAQKISCTENYQNVQNSGIKSNSKGIILQYGESQAMIRYNAIKENEIGLEIEIGSFDNFVAFTISNNNIFENTEYDARVIGSGKLDIDAPDNWWGTIDISIIEGKIYDYYDDITKGRVIYEPTATQAFESVDFSASPRSGSYPLDVTFTNHSMGVINSVIWDFGDGTTSTELNPTHTYDTLGTYTVNLTVTTPDGASTEIKVDYITIESTTTTTITVSTTTTTSEVTTTISDECPIEEIYGEDSEEVAILRYFRDSVLSKTTEGKEIIRLYYEWSSLIVKAMERDEGFKEEVKEMVDGILMLIGGGAE